MFALHGGIFLILKTEGELHERVKHLVPRLMIGFFVLKTIVVVGLACSTTRSPTATSTDIWPVSFRSRPRGAARG